MLPRHHPGRVQITFDGHRLVANAGLILPATLALRLGLSQLLGKRLGLGDAPGRANTGGKLMTLAASALAGGDCTGGTARVPGFTAKAPSTLGAFLRSFRWGHVRQPDRVSRELLARARAAGDGPGGAPFTIGLDSTVCETCGLAKEGARHHGCTGQRGYTRCWPSPPAPAACCCPGCTRAGPTPPAAPPAFCGRRWAGCATAGPAGNSRCGPTAASIPAPWPPSAAGWMSASPSPSASTPACGT